MRKTGVTMGKPWARSRQSRNLKKSSTILALMGFLGLNVFLQMLGGKVTFPEISGWYQQLNKPPWTPPGIVFGPVWTLLYISMAVAAWRVWKKVGLVHRAMGLYFLQLLLNTLWSYLFFWGHSIGLALLDLVLLNLAVLMTSLNFWRIDRGSGLLFIPYAAWVMFACTLNWKLWTLNP